MKSRAWIRPALVGVFVLTLPFTWVERSGGCARVYETPIRESGLTLARDNPPVATAIVAALAFAITLGFLARQTHVLLQVVAEITAMLLLAASAAAALFLATFHLFQATKLRAASIVGLGALSVGALEALWNAISKIVDRVRERRDRN